jgi:hypothetical protein
MIDRDLRCRRYRASLVDFADHGEIGPLTADALGHLDRCGSCTGMLESAVLTIAALRRLGDDVAHAEPRADGWPRLRARLEAWRPVRLALLSPLAGMAMALGLAIGLVAPLHVGPNPWGSALEAGGSADPGATASALVYSSAARRTADVNESPGSSRPRVTVQTKSTYPDGTRPVHEEVPSAHSTPRPTELR